MENIFNFLKSEAVLFRLELLLRIIIAFFCGSFIGRERKHRGKGAGTKTHAIVAIASCLLMIISQYGFMDFLTHFDNEGININHDPSRIAAQIVTGIGFLGAGMIFVHKKTITGLTTAAGIWATAGIGMAIGAGMYFISISTTLLIIIVQYLSHTKMRFFTPATEIDMVLTVSDKDSALSHIKKIFEEEDIHIINVQAIYRANDCLKLIIAASTIHEFDKMDLANKFYLNDTITSVKI